MLRVASLALVCTLSVGAVSAEAKDKTAKTYVVVNEAVGVPVFPYDITDRPYEVIGEGKAEIRKATIFSKEASQEKIYRELWERGEKLGADAVIKAGYGDSRVTLMSWGSTAATGTAIRFVAAAATPEPAAAETAEAAIPASAEDAPPADTASGAEEAPSPEPAEDAASPQ